MTLHHLSAIVAPEFLHHSILLWCFFTEISSIIKAIIGRQARLHRRFNFLNEIYQ